MFRRIFIDNYKAFNNFELRPERINLLVGSNGTCKSTFLRLLRQVVHIIVRGHPVVEVFPTGSQTRWEQRRRQSVEFDFEVGGVVYSYSLVVLDGAIQSERVGLAEVTLFSYEAGQVYLFNNEGTRGTFFSFRGQRSFLSEIEQREETRKLMTFLRALTNVASLNLDVRSIEAMSEGESSKLTPNGSNFPSWYRHASQQNPEELHSLWEALRSAIPGFQVLKLTSTGVGNLRELGVSLRAGESAPYVLGFSELSDGQRGLIILYSLLHLSEEKTPCFLLDEPEAHVGLEEIQPWLVQLDDKFEDRGQVFVISHHPSVVDYLAAGRPFCFERPAAGPVRVRTEVFERESGASASEQLARGLIDAK